MSEDRAVAMDELQRRYLEAMGIQVWERRAPNEGSRFKVQGSTGGEVEPRPAESDPAAQAPEHQIEVVSGDIQKVEQAPADLEPSTLNLEPVSSLDWPQLRERVAACRSCEELAASRTRTGFGAGNPNADWLVVGHVPDAEDERQGELFTAMLASIGLGREQVYLTNVLKCQPPGDRDPTPKEAQACSAYLQRQIALVQPKLILAVGRSAAQHLLNSNAPIDELRGRVHRLESGVAVVATYHPAYLLRSPQDKRKAWADLCLARATLSAAAGAGG